MVCGTGVEVWRGFHERVRGVWEEELCVRE